MNAQEYLIKMDTLIDMTKSAFADFARTTEAAIRAERPQVLAIDEDNTEPEKLQLDVALLAAAPVAVVPAHSNFFPLQESSHRFLLAADGIYLEARRPWLHFIHRLAQISGARVPYGSVAAKAEFPFGRLSEAMAQLQEFALHASAAAPIEAAGSVIWNSVTGAWRIAYPEVIGEASAVHIEFKQVELADDEHLVIDLHSHGNGPAGFSDTDNRDDAGSVKISGVYGNLDQSEPTVAFRICVLGVTIPLSVPAAKIFA
jgi:PRTRC genetic system protein A